MSYRQIRCASAIFCFLFVVGTASAGTFLKIPGVNGTSRVEGRADWSDVESEAINIAPPLVDKKVVTPQCTASVAATLGAAAASVASLVGVPIGGDVVIEVTAGPDAPLTIYQALLKGAVITHYGSTSSAGVFHDSLALQFTQLVLKTTEQKPDGTPGEVRTGSFDCLHP